MGILLFLFLFSPFLLVFSSMERSWESFVIFKAIFEQLNIFFFFLFLISMEELQIVLTDLNIELIMFFARLFCSVVCFCYACCSLAELRFLAGIWNQFSAFSPVPIGARMVFVCLLTPSKYLGSAGFFGYGFVLCFFFLGVLNSCFAQVLINELFCPFCLSLINLML